MPEPATWRLLITTRARRDVRRLDPPVRQRIVAAFDQLTEDPHGADLRRLVGRPELRLRVGDWRVLLELKPEERSIVIYRVLPRGRAYRD